MFSLRTIVYYFVDLRLCEEAYSQCFNNNKTSIFFSRNTFVDDKEAILEILGLSSTQRYDTYLGFPALVGKSHTAAFRGSIDECGRSFIIGS
jgi:hypothetical protein